MILGLMENTFKAELTHPLLKQAFDYLRKTDLESLLPGKITPKGEDFFIVVLEMQGKSKEQALLETHKNYIDIHLPLITAETFGWSPTNKCKQIATVYNVETDIEFLNDKPNTYFDVQVGEFVVFFPEDAHAPAISSDFIRKILAKIPV